MGYNLSNNWLTKSETCHKWDLNMDGEDNISPPQPPELDPIDRSKLLFAWSGFDS